MRPMLVTLAATFLSYNCRVTCSRLKAPKLLRHVCTCVETPHPHACPPMLLVHMAHKQARCCLALHYLEAKATKRQQLVCNSLNKPLLRPQQQHNQGAPVACQPTLAVARIDQRETPTQHLHVSMQCGQPPNGTICSCEQKQLEPLPTSGCITQQPMLHAHRYH